MIPPLFSILVFDYAFPQRNVNWLYLALGGGFIAYILYQGIASWAEYLNSRLDNRMNAELSADMFKTIADAPLEESQRFKTGDMTVRLIEDADIITGLLLNLPSHVLISGVQLIIFFAIAIIMDPWVTLLGIIAVPFYIWETGFFSHRLESLQEKLQESDSTVLEGLQEKLQNIRTIKSFNRENSEKERMASLFQHRARLSIRYKLMNLYQAFASSLTLQIWTVLITLYLGFEVIRGVLSIGQMISLGIYLPLIQEPISDLAWVWTQARVGSVSLRRIEELEQLHQEGTDEPGEVGAVSPLRGDIHFDDVTFAYGDSVPVIRGLQMTLKAQQMSAIVGPSGIGKSTLAYLLLRMYPLRQGRVLIGDTDIQSVGTHQLRQQIGVVFQESALFSGTIRENICYGKPDATEEEVEAATERANAAAFIAELPQGYETPLLSWGKNLSGGQRQRLSLARSLLRKPSILILDEITSALDAEAGFLIEEALEKLRQHMTIVLITHQLSAAKKADQILMLDEGQIVEQGTFQALMNSKGRFFDLYNIQTGGFQEFIRRFEIEIERHIRYAEPLSLVLLQPVRYTQWKQQESPPRLALIMETICQSIRRHLRVMDFCTLYTDKTIAVVLPQTYQEGMTTMLDRMKKVLEETMFSVADESYTSEFTVGTSSCSADEWTYTEQLFVQAERDLLSRKEG